MQITEYFHQFMLPLYVSFPKWTELKEHQRLLSRAVSLLAFMLIS